MGDYVADCLAVHVGRPDLVRELQPSVADRPHRLPPVDVSIPVTLIRCHAEVYELLRPLAAQRGQGVAGYVAAFCRNHVTQPDAAVPQARLAWELDLVEAG